jgi:hypothetical protein
MSLVLRASKLAPFAVALMLLGGCETMEGYPTDPTPEKQLEALRTVYFPSAQNCPDKTTPNDALECQYYDKDKSAAERQSLRDKIVLGRMHIYDMEFSLFVRALSANNNYFSVGSDLTALAFSGLATTTGNAATKSALAAVSSGVLAANGTVNKDLFYQKTVPAIIAQMEADRSKVEATILAGLGKPIDAYSLARAQLDLDTLNDSGSLNAAVVTITHDAGNAKAAAQAAVDANRSIGFAPDAVSARLNAWIWPGSTASANGAPINPANGAPATPSAANLTALKTWMLNNGLAGIPVATFMNSALLASARAQAAASLGVP